MKATQTQAYRLSPQQDRLWSLLQQQDLGLHGQIAVLIEGPLAKKRIEDALTELVGRHEILRTTFRRPSGLKVPLQMVDGNGSTAWQSIDLARSDGREPEFDVNEWLRKERETPFDFAEGPLSRFYIVTLSAQRHVVVASQSALCTDAWSLNNFARQLAELYASGSKGDQAADETFQYAAYASWQHELLEGDEAEAGRTFWAKQNLLALPPIHLPFERKSGTLGSAKRASFVSALDRRVVERCQALASELGTTVERVCLAVWQSLLSRITDTPEVVIGYRAQGREYEDLYGLMGPVGRSLPVHSHLDGTSSLRQRCAEIAESMEDLLEWQDYFTWERNDDGADTGRAAYLPIGFEFATLPAKQQVGDVTFSVLKLSTYVEPFHVRLICEQSEEALHTEFQYASERLGEDDIRRLQEQYSTLLENALAAPDTPMGSLDILSQRARTQILVEFNSSGQVESASDRCVHQLFEAEAARRPDAIAVVHEREMLTYAALDERAGCLSGYLQTLGVGPGVSVAIRMDRSLDMIVGILGILKAGGAYVPIDPSVPKRRAEALLEDSAALVLLTHGSWADALDGSAKVVALDRDWDAVAQHKGRSSSLRVTPGDVVYTLFTSGSTGTPKGVQVEHRQLVNYVRGVVARLEPPSGASFATVSTIAADLGNTAVFSALCTGGCLHVIAEARLHDPDAMAAYFAERHIDCLKIVPSHLDALLAAAHPEHVVSCGRLVLGGEASRWQLIEKIKTLAPGCVIFNHYGPTETTVGVLAHRFIDDRHSERSATLPIGRPLSGSQIYLLDDNSSPVPIGIAGELYIGGDGLSRGYVNRASQTAERFVPHPLSGKPGARLYRTGDLARYLPDGNIEFLGRADHQVKIRGFRIELGEIESVLRQYPAVQGVVVVTRDGGPSGVRLVAYVVGTPGQGVSSSELREFARERLPDYMVPAVFMLLSAIPLTKNGKIDRAALPAPEEAEREREKVAPRNDAESKLSAIWSELLGIDQPSVLDNFFELGGHSLSAMQLVSRIRRAFDVELPLLTIFEAPTIEGLASRISQAPGTATASVAPPIVPVKRGTAIAASYSQERLWLFDQLQPGSSAYNIPAAARITGVLDVPALEQTFHAVVDRHEVLRTTFDSVDGRPVQLIAARRRTRMAVVDLRELSEEQRVGPLEKLVRLHARHPFDLSNGPVWRATLVRLGPEEHVVLWNQHHISSDGWSAAIFVRELSELYSSFSRGGPSALAPLTIQYADYSQWQRNWLESTGETEQLAYWKQHLDGVPSSLALSTDRPRPPAPSYRGGAESVTLSPELSKALTALGNREGATIYITLLSALDALLHLHTGQTDIVVGSPTAGRSQGETEGLIGFFLNTLALRTKVKSDVSFLDLLHQVRAVVLDAFAHQELPFERIVEELQIERDASRPALYQVMFNHQRTSGARLEFGDLRIAAITTAETASKFDLTLYATEGPEQIALRLVYNSDIFDASTVAVMLARFVVLLEAIVADPGRKVSSLSLLTKEERAPRYAPALTLTYPPAFTRFESSALSSSVSERFERQVAAYPNNIAVKTPRHEWTYRQLDAEATRVAGTIEAFAGDSETRVGLLFESGAPLMAAIMGTLKAGQTYVPLDPSNPRDRLAYMLQHSEARVLLTDTAHFALARELAGDSVAVVNSEDTSMNAPFARVRRASADSIAYILYTSGSTGVPKGVVQSHRNLLHFMRVYTNNLGIHHGDRLSLLSSYGFDGAVMDIFAALLNGATLVPANLMGEGLDGALKRIGDAGVTVFHSTPTVFRQLFSSAPLNGELKQIRVVVLGGEEALKSDLELFKLRFPREALLVNGLGPSESTVTLQHFMDHDTVNTRTSLPVGLPVDETEILLLDESGGTTEVYGEIAIRSPHVALGYWRDEGKTAAAFTSEPDQNGRRVYRTGDIGRRLPDGILEFVGRKDTQVKIRGFRIELGEIESVLGEHPSVQECAVLARVDNGAARLIAYVRPSKSQTDMATELRSFIKQKLPEYMVPAAFVIQSSLPVTANGKLDRNALPKVEVKPEAEVEVIAPRTAVERRIAALWTEVLGRERISVLDDFFAVGGHSLLAMRLISRIRSSFEIELALRLIFESPTLEGMAGHVEAALRSDAGSRRRLAPIESTPRDGLLPLSFAQQRMWILDQLEPGGATYNVPAAVELRGALQLSALEQAIDAIVLRHEVLRTTFRKSNQGEPEQVIGNLRRRGMPVVDLSMIPAEGIERALDRLALHEAQHSFDLTTGPLFRVTTLRVTGQRHVVLFTMHHIVSDGWSTSVLIRELSELYHALVAGRRSTLPPLPIQYADYAAWQRQYLESDVLQEQLDYWKRQLDGIPEQLALPLDRRRGADVSYNGAREPFSLEGPLVGTLASLGREEGTTLFVSLLSVFQMLLHRYTGQQDIVVGAPIAGRTVAETEPLIGFFINTLVLRSHVNPTRTFRQLLRDVHEMMLNATANQDLPFERLVDELNPVRGVGHTPLFQVAFVLQNAPRETLTMSDLTLRNRPMETRTAKFDWSISLIEAAEGIFGNFEYNTDLFDDTTIRRIIHDFQNLMAQCVASPDRVIADLEVLDIQARKRALVEWNDTVREYPREVSIPALFEEQVEQTPDAVAVVDGVTHLTYRELNIRANRLARYLRRRGVGPESKVGIYLERSTEFIVAVMAALKSGGVYAPLDTAYPEERIGLMAADAGVQTVLTIKPLEQGVAGIGVTPILLDTGWPEIMRESGEDLRIPVPADQLAYVIYTSGSTGRPKGIAVPHRAVVRLVRNTNYVDLGPADVLAHVSNTSFDAATFEIWGALLQGGVLAVIPSDTVVSSTAYKAALRRHQVTSMFVTSALFNRMIADDPNSFATVHNVLVGGEAVDPAAMRRALSTAAPTRLLNGYGPTENTTFSSWYPITHVDEDAYAIPIGRPIGNSRMLVLDASYRLVPVGASGELYVGGDGLARQYMQRPDLTAERFVPDPYPVVPGALLYRTGDIVTQNPDGNVVYQGRADHQVKIRGFRIELGEIEAAIAVQEGVRDSIVLVREDIPGDKRLVAYLVVDPLRSPSTSDLRSALRSRLPEYMVPSAFVVLDALPLTPNGKVDRRALPAPGQTWGGGRAWGDAAAETSQPSTDIELEVARIWKSVLGTDVVLDDKFFDLGGHSLNAIQVVTRIEKELGCEIKFNDLIFQTLRQVAASCEKQLADHAE